MKILVVGAGVGGLTLAVAAQRRGFEVTVLEKRSALAQEGAGIVLGPNVMAALEPLGLAEPILEISSPVESMAITDSLGRVLSQTHYSSGQLPFTGRAAHRSLLLTTLREAFEGEIRLGSDVSAFQTAPRPSVRSDAELFEADLVVAADGIRSRLREALVPGFMPRYSGTTCWRFVVDHQPSDQVVEMWGVGKRVGVVPLAGGQSYVFLTANAAPRTPSPFENLSDFKAYWSEFEQPAKGVLDALGDLSRVLHNDLEDGIPSVWHRPGLVLLGDSAHAVTPNLGQGAGLAVEDACCLASLLGAPDALSRYEALRRPRATWIRDRSYAVGKVAQLENRWLCKVRNKLVSWTPDSANQATMKRLLLEMPGVPIASR